MTFNSIMEKFYAEDPKMILDALEELSQACSDASAEAQRAREAYYASAKEKEKKVVERTKVLKELLEDCEIRIEALKKPLVAATVAGDSGKLDIIKAKMKELEVEKLQLTTEIGMLENTHIVGDEDLYNKVVEKNSVHIKLREDYFKAKVETYRLAEEKIKDYEKIKKTTQNFRAGGGYGVNMQEIDRHFNFEKYAELEKSASGEALRHG